MSELRIDELAQTPLSSLILLDQSYGGLALENQDSEHVTIHALRVEKASSE
jgi:hypothetical protein